MSCDKYEEIYNFDLPARLREKFGQHIFEGVSDFTPLGKFLLAIRDASVLEKREAILEIEQAFSLLAVNIKKFNLYNAKDADFDNVNTSLGYIAVPVDEFLECSSEEDKENLLRNYIRQRYDYFEPSEISQLEIDIFISCLEIPFSKRILGRFSLCPYYEPAIYQYEKSNNMIASNSYGHWARVATLITSGIVARLSQKDIDEVESAKLCKRLQSLAQTERYDGSALERLPELAEILKKHPVILTGSNMALDITGQKEMFSPWKILCKKYDYKERNCQGATLRIYTPETIVEIPLKANFLQDCALSIARALYKRTSYGNVSGEVYPPRIEIFFENGQVEQLQLSQGCDADLIVLPEHDLNETASSIFEEEKERNPSLELIMELETRTTGMLFNIRAVYPKDDKRESLVDFINYLPKQIYQTDPSFVFRHHIHAVRAYLQWDCRKENFVLHYDPSYCGGSICPNFFCIASRKEPALEIVRKYIQRGICFGKLDRLVDLDEKHYCWIRA